MTVNYNFPTVRVGLDLTGTVGTFALDAADGNTDGFSDDWIAWSFIAPPNGPTLSKVSVYCTAVAGTLTGLSCAIYSDVGAVPNTSLQASTTVTALPTGAAWVEFTGFTYTLTAGAVYWIVIRNATATPASNYPTIGYVYGCLPLGCISTAIPTYYVKATADSGSTWTGITARVGAGGYRLEWSDGGFSGWPIETTGSTLTGKAYGTVETGVKFTTPAVGKATVAGCGAYIRKDGTPGDMRARIYAGSTLVATSAALPVANAINANYVYLMFATPVTLARNTAYRVVIGCVSGGDSTSNHYRLYAVRVKNDANSLAMAPLRGWGATDFNGTDWTDTPTICPSVFVFLDGDSGEFAEPTQPAVGDVQDGVSYNDAASTGTLVVPLEADVESGVGYGAGGTEFTGTLVADEANYPAVSDVRYGVDYGAAGPEFTGTVVIPAVADVRDGTTYGAGGTEYEGEMVVYSTWTETEKSHIRYRLGIDGTEAAPTNTPTLGTLTANVTQWNGTNVSAPNVAGVPKVDVAYVLGEDVNNDGSVDANVVTVATDAIDADALAADAGTEIGAAVKTAIEAAGSHLTLILEDTGTTLPATLDTIDNFLDTEIAAILQDTDEMQKDLMNGGRLDLLIDAIKAKTDLMLDAAAIRTALEADGSKLDVLYDDWLNGGRLDLLLDAAAAGGDVFSTELPGAYAVGTAGYIIGTNLDAKVSEAGGGAGDGTGADEVTITWTSNGLPVGGGDVWITTDPSGDNVVAGTLQTNDNGQATFMLDDGSVYFLWGQRSGVNSIRGERFVAVAD